MNTPDTTSAQVLSLVTGVIALVVAFGFVDEATSQKFIAAFGIIVPAVVVIADGIIRNGRARVLAAPPVIHVHNTETTSGIAALDSDSDVTGQNDPSAE